MIKTILSSIRKVVNKMYGYFIQKTLDTFSILIDSREQQNKRAQLRYQQFGTTPYDRATLDIGDYTYSLLRSEGENRPTRCSNRYAIRLADHQRSRQVMRDGTARGGMAICESLTSGR